MDSSAWRFQFSGIGCRGLAKASVKRSQVKKFLHNTQNYVHTMLA